MNRKKLYAGLILMTAFGLGLTAMDLPDKFDKDLLTGKFTEAGNSPDKSQKASVERVYWNFGDGEKKQGRIAKHNFTPGTYNITVTVVKSNGENETHRGRIEVE